MIAKTGPAASPRSSPLAAVRWLTSDHREIPSLLALFALLLVAFFARAVDPASLRDLHPRPDTTEYVFAARNLIERGRFEIAINGVFLPSRYSIGFPLLIVPSFLLRGETYTNAIFSVLVLNLGSIALVYWIGRRLSGSIAGLVGAAVVVFSPLDVSVGQRILSDEPSGFFVLLATVPLTYLTFTWASSERTSRTIVVRDVCLAAVAGALLAYSDWIRQINAIYVPAFGLCVLVGAGALRSRRNLIGPTTALPAAGFLAAWAIAQAPVLWFNQQTFGSIMRTGYNLWAPSWYNSFGTMFSVKYALGGLGHPVSFHMGPEGQSLVYFRALIGLPAFYDISGAPTTLYSPVVAGLALVGVAAQLRQSPKLIGTSIGRSRRRAYVILAALVTVLTFAFYSGYFYFSTRFLDVCVLFIAVLAGQGAAVVIDRARLLLTRKPRWSHTGLVVASLLVAGVLVWQTGFVPVAGPWLRTRFFHEPPINTPAYDLVDFISKQTEDNAYVVTDLSLIYFSAMQVRTGRTLIPFTADEPLPPAVTDPSFVKQPDRVLRLVDRGARVYFLGDPIAFAKTPGTSEMALHLAAARHFAYWSDDVRLFRLSHISLSLLSALSRASIVSPAGDVPKVEIRSQVVGGVTRTAILAHPISQIAFNDVSVPRGAYFTSAIGIAQDCVDLTAGAHFEVVVTANGSRQVVFHRDLRPRQQAGERGWQDVQVDLSPWARQHVSIELLTTAINADYTCAWALWGDPTIETYTLG